MEVASKMVGGAVKTGAKKVGSFIDKQFIEPSRNVNRIQDAKMKAMDKQAKSGAFN